MRAAVAFLAGLAGIAAAADVTCSDSYDGSFEIEIVNATTSRRTKRDTALVLTLTDGYLYDAEGRQGYIASNYQFQFNTPVQTNAIYVDGFSVCSNDSLELNGNAIWYECLSGTFYNLYDESIASYCSEAYIQIIPVSSSSSASTTTTVSGAASTESDGQVTGSAVSEYTDGQPQVYTTTSASNVVTESSDGQPEVATATTTASSTSSSATGVVTESSDGQPEVATSAATTSAATTSAVTTTSSNATTAATSATYTGGVAMQGASFGGLAAFVLAVFAL